MDSRQIAASNLMTAHSRFLKALANEYGFVLTPDQIFLVTATLGECVMPHREQAPETLNGFPVNNVIGGD